MYMQVNDENSSSRRIPGVDLRGTGYCPNLNFRRTARAVTRLFDLAFQSSGVRSTQFTILVAVAKTHPCSISALSSVLFIDSTTLTRSLRLLQKEGWLTVSARSTRRQRFVTLTPSGEHVLARTVPLWRRAQEQFVETVGQNYWLNLRGELERLAHLAVDLEKSAGGPAAGPTITQ
jgi:DNA-binding MarR family transcriptional regulator